MTTTQFQFSVIGSQIDAATGLIKGVSLITEGVVLGHDCFVDSKTNKTVFAACQKLGRVKCKLNHGTDVTSIVGYLDNFRIEGNQVKADLQLLKECEQYKYILELASKLTSNFGLSIAFKPEFETIKDRQFVRCSEIYSADIVDSPAANPNGLFSRKTNQPTNPMNTIQTDDGLEAVNASVLARYSKSNMRIKHFTSNDGSGFVPALGSEEPDTADLLAQLVRDGRFKEAGDLLVQIQKGPRVTASTAVKSRPNAYGPTRGTVHVRSNDGRKTVVDAQSFSTTTNVLNVDQSKALIEAAKKQNRKEYEAGVRKSHKSTKQELRVNNDTVVNYSRVDMESIADMHAESIIADKATYEANKKRIAEREARLSRIKNGRGTLEDLQARRNALRNA